MWFKTMRKLLCGAVACFNIGLMLWIIVYVIVTDAKFNSSTSNAVQFLLCGVNILQAALMLVGVVKNRPSYIKAFLALLLLQIGFLAWVIIQGYRRFVIFRPEALLWFIVIFAFESLIALDGMQAVLKTLPPVVEPNVIIYSQN